MSNGKSEKIVYKPYEQKQLYLLPESADELISEKHLVRVVNRVVEEMEVEKILERQQKGGGTSRYNPVMLVKVLVYSYLDKVYTSRQIAKQLNA